MKDRLAKDTAAQVAAWAKEARRPEAEVIDQLVRLTVLSLRMRKLTPLLQELREAVVPRARWGSVPSLILSIVDARREGWSAMQIAAAAKDNHDMRINERTVRAVMGRMVRNGLVARVRRGVVTCVTGQTKG